MTKRSSWGLWIAGDPQVVALQIFSDEGLEYFPTRTALNVDGVAGFVYVLSYRSFAPTPGQENLIKVTLGGGPVILTEGDVPDWARTGDDTPDPGRQADGGSRWWG